MFGEIVGTSDGDSVSFDGNGHVGVEISLQNAFRAGNTEVESIEFAFDA